MKCNVQDVFTPVFFLAIRHSLGVTGAFFNLGSTKSISIKLKTVGM